MRSRVIMRFVGSFLQVFGATLLVPLLAAIYYADPWVTAGGFVLSAFTSIVLGTGIKLSGNKGAPSVNEAMFSTVLGWILAIILGAIPMMTHIGLTNALFESAAGLTTTGISMVAEPQTLPMSLLFWRSFMQWVGGLGILTFFIAVIRESGGASRRLFSAEAHKTDSGSIRPSLVKSITALWRVYGFFTVIIAATFIVLGMPVFESLLHGFSTISTGGFSTRGASIGAFGSPLMVAVTTLFMFVGGVNFVLLYRFLRSEFSALFQSSEFRLYTKTFIITAVILSAGLWRSGFSPGQAVLDGAFQAAAFISSTGYSTISLGVFSAMLQLWIVAVMFVGGSLGSTAGGLKVFRLKTLIELLRVRIRAYSLPETAINEVKIDGEILENSTVRTISVLFFAWLSVVFVSTLLTLGLEDISLMAALSGSVSAASNMGPVFLPFEEMVGFSPITKTIWMIVMLAGRLEMLPALAIFNSELFEDRV